MVCKLLKKGISLAVAFALVLSLSCCGAGDEIPIEETTQAATSSAAETTTNEITEDITTSETTTEKATETTTEETTFIIPDEETILASLTDEEKEVWLSMPDIVTMRALYRYDKDDNFLYTEIVYIDKMGQTKKFITYGDSGSPDYDITIAWLNDKISQNEDAELVDVVSIQKLIKFYNAFICIDNDSKYAPNYTVGLAVYIERHYWFELYGIRNNGNNDLETLLISEGDAGYYYLRRNNTDEEKPRDESGRKTFDLYLKIDPFMVDSPGGLGHLTGEEG